MNLTRQNGCWAPTLECLSKLGRNLVHVIIIMTRWYLLICGTVPPSVQEKGRFEFLPLTAGWSGQTSCITLKVLLQVIGNMAAALGAARPALQSSVIQCIKQPAASASVQQAAVQVYRQTPVPEEVSC